MSDSREKCRACGYERRVHDVEHPYAYSQEECDGFREPSLPWTDRQDEWSLRIDEAHPVRSGAHKEYATAMQMVGNRHSKGELVDLVTWLLVRLKTEKSA